MPYLTAFLVGKIRHFCRPSAQNEFRPGNTVVSFVTSKTKETKKKIRYVQRQILEHLLSTTVRERLLCVIL